MKFSKTKFIKNAPLGIKRQIEGFLDILDGTEVIFDGKYGRDGYIRQQFHNGLEYHLHPIYRNWCK